MSPARLFTLDGAKRSDAAVERWFASPPADMRQLAKRWFDEMRACGPDVFELLHDGHPTTCVGDLAFGYVNAFSDHVNVGFYFGAVIPDPARLLQGAGKFMRHVKVGPGIAVDEGAFKQLIASAYSDIKARREE